MKVTLQNLTKIFPSRDKKSGKEVVAVNDFTFEIPDGKLIGLLGPSGCGKSTFLKTLNRMNDLIPSVKITGEVLYNGENIFTSEVNNLRKEVGMVFQKPNPFPMSIYDNIAYGPRTHGIKNKAQLDDIVEKALRGRAPDREGQAKLIASLARKGFRYEDIRAALCRVDPEGEDGGFTEA